MDYSKLRERTLDSGRDEEAVTVNTRALIDKVLARYSGEWTTLRELIQNAADASATKVTIKFETMPSSTVPTPQTTDTSAHIKHTVQHHTLKRLVVSNNGHPFEENDWSRLKRIAEGNPDETKIGAFGVGFYSVFAECENPFVTSGKESMAFYWKGNSLFTRRAKLPDDIGSADTCFVLDYRNQSTTIPNLMSICQFLSSSLTFIALESIELWLDSWNVFSLSKKSAPSVTVPIPKDIETTTQEGMMKITGVDCQNAQIDASWMNIVGWTPSAMASNSAPVLEVDKSAAAPSLRSFFSRLTGTTQNTAAAKRAAKEEEALQQVIAEDITGSSRATVFIRINTVHIKTTVSSSFSTELERATKKKPPKTTRIAILTSSFDETSASLSTLSGSAASKASQIITSVLPSKNGRVFIGFPTAQTTGLLAHISAPSLIPTVERESIDLNARWVRTWNTELLSIAGIACRLAYIGEMATLRDKLSTTSAGKRNEPTEADIDALIPAAVHSLKQYTFTDSTPLAKVGNIINSSFWYCNKKTSIELFSTRGVLPSHDIRVASETLSFVNRIPVLPEQILKENHDFVSRLQDWGLLQDITTTDITKELEKQAINESQLEELLKWASKKRKTNQYDQAAIQSLFAAAIANIEILVDGKKERSILLLRDVETFVNTSKIPPELPMPEHTIPFKLTKSLSHAEMQSFGWEQLQVIPWLRFLVDRASLRAISESNDITKSPAFAAQVLSVVSKGWEQLSQSSRTSAIEMLSPRAVIPTKLGMRKPSDSYFASVKLFDDLPTFNNPNNVQVKEKFLKELGVRKTIELSVIFERLMTTSSKDGSAAAGSWSHVDLIRYLVSVWNDIPAQDIAQLQKTALCPAEIEGDQKSSTTKRYKVSDLFEPKDSFRGLGLPVLQWPGQLNAFSSEGKFLKLLGLRPYPHVPELIDILARSHASRDLVMYERAMKYYLENHYQNNYVAFDVSGVKTSFLPIKGSDKAAKPDDCFTEEKASLLGYNVLRDDLQAHAPKLGVRTNPPMADCAGRLIQQPPLTRKDARQIFGYFASRPSDMSSVVIDKLGRAPIVPITPADSEKSTRARFATPTSCFLGDGQEYGDIFDYVDFGPEANLFLLKIGCKHEPSTVELTQLLIREPARILQTLQVDKYLGLLRKLYVNMATLKKDKALWKEMKRAPFLMGYIERPADQSRRKSMVSQEANLDGIDEPEPMVKEWHLRSADKINIIDDYYLFNLFKQAILSSPQEENLEELYFSLGSPLISTVVEEEPKLGPRSVNQKEAEKLKELVIERTRLFLHEQPPERVRHDARWLEKNLEVQLVQSVSLRRTLKGPNLTHVEKRSAAMTPSAGKKYLLSITTGSDVFQVSQEIVHLIIDRPKTQTYMIFEMFMATNLYKLRARGYNVDRVLKKKEDARIAETERQRKEELEKQKQEDLKKIATMPNGNVSTQAEPPNTPGQTRAPEVQMPGAFGNDSPDHPTSNGQDSALVNRQIKKPQGLLSQLSKRLGFNEQSGQGGQDPIMRDLQNFISGQASQSGQQPPPYSPYDPQQPRGPGQNQGQVESVTAPDRVQQNLQSAISASRAYNSNSLFSRPETNAVKETGSYCDHRPGHSLKQIATANNGMPIYLSSDNITTASSAEFLTANRASLDDFATVIQLAGSVFPVPASTLHIFYDDSGSSIAFNSGGAIFCNFRFFAQLHAAGMMDPQARAQALVYWWVVLTHELAHNLVGDHSSAHSYYTEQFVASYFPSCMGKVLEIVGAGSSIGNSRPVNAPPGIGWI